MDRTIKFKSLHRFTGTLYGWHDDPLCGEHYQMSITDDKGKEVLHSYNAEPKTAEGNSKKSCRPSKKRNKKKKASRR